MKKLVRWQKKIDAENIVAAIDYLRLLFSKSEIKEIEKQLKKNSSNLSFHKASDLIRSSGSHVITGTHKDVSKQLQKIILKKVLEPIVIITSKENIYIADGYHRICACYSIDDEIMIPAVQIELK